MRYDIFLNRTANILAENRLLKFFIVVIAISNVLFGYMAYQAVKYRTVVLVPWGLKTKVTVQGNTLSENYLYEMARVIFDLALNYSPATVKTQYELLLTMWDPETYSEYQRRFSVLEEEVATGKLTSVFVPSRIQHDPDKQIVKATGRRVLLLEGEKVAESSEETYAFSYRVRAGRLFIKDFGKWSEMKSLVEKAATTEKQTGEAVQ